MSDLINRQNTADVMERWLYDGEDKRTVREVVYELPSVEPEIIKCKDCKGFRRWIDTDVTFCDLTDGTVSESDFCSRAERRTE